MHAYLVVPLAAALAAAAAAGAVFARDPGHRANRLVAALLACCAGWCTLEVIWNPLHDAEWVVRLVRLSSFFWVPLGPLTAELAIEVAGDPGGRVRRRLPWVWASAGAAIALYVGTPWGIEHAVPTPWGGWSFAFGPLFGLVYLPCGVPAAAALAWMWRSMYPPGAPAAERRQGRAVLVGLVVPLATATATDALLPLLGYHVPRLGSASVATLGLVIAWSVQRTGHSMLLPGAFSREILAALREGVALLRSDGVVRVANPGLGRLFGCAPEALVGRPLGELLPGLPLHPAPSPEERECELRSEAGERIAVSVSATELRDKQGGRVGTVVVLRDLREVASLRARLVTSGRLAAVGQLAAGLAHEINNPVAYVSSNLRQLLGIWSDVAKEGRAGALPEAMREELDEGLGLITESLDGVARVAAIVSGVRAFSHAGTGTSEPTDVNEAVRSALRIAGPQIPPGATVETVLADLPPVRGNAQQLQQVFLNLVVNAVQAIGPQGSVRLVTGRDGADVHVRVEDDGCGMAADVQERIFDPFFTTKPVGQGTGLGLSISYQIVRDHGGDLSVESAPGRGACFRVRLPAA